MTYVTEDVPCPLCHGASHTIYLKDVPELYVGTGFLFDIVRCDHCGFCYTNPRPRKEDVGIFYPDNAGYYRPRCDAQAIAARREGLCGFFKRYFLAVVFGYRHLVPAWLPVATFLKTPLLPFCRGDDIPRYRENGRLLEIGCSTGLRLKKMECLGWTVAGVELNAAAVSYAQQSLGLQDVRAGFFEDFSFAEGSFDVVYSSMVLEHAYDPRDMIKRIRRVLASGGEFIFSVPDIEGCEISWYGKYAYPLQVPQHVSHFSVSSVTNLLEQEGFTVETVRHQSVDRDLVASAGYAKRKVLAAFLHNAVVRIFVVRPFIALLAVLGKTSRMTVYARKR